MKPSGDKILLATRKGLIQMNRNKSGWEFDFHAFPGLAISFAMRNPHDGDLWACLDTGHFGAKLQRSSDEGKNWQDVQMPTYPEGAEISDGVPATLSYAWLLTTGHASDPKRMYLGTEPGGLFQSDDAGKSFLLVEGLWNHPSRKKGWFGGGRDFAGLCSIQIDPRDKKHIFVAISVGGVFESLDEGQIWTPRNKGLEACYLPDPYPEVGHDPHSLVMAPSNPDVLWQQNHCGIFRTTDAAQNWTKVSDKNVPAHFGFPVLVDPQDENTAWVVPGISDEMRMAVDGALCVSRSTDGGISWTAYRKGLPQVNSSDEVYRHAIDLNGDRIVFGSTTGNLFISEDRGESWQVLSNYLPPIHSLRFI